MKFLLPKTQAVFLLFSCLSFKPHIVSASSLEPIFSSRASKNRIDSSINFLQRKRTKHSNTLSKMQEKINQNRLEFDVLEDESKILLEDWKKDLAFFEDAVKEKQRIINEMVEERNKLAEQIFPSDKTKEHLSELDADIDDYISCLAAMIHHKPDQFNPTTRTLINETYRPKFEELSKRKQLFQNEFENLSRELNEKKKMILVEFQQEKSEKLKKYDDLKESFEEKLNTIFNEEEVSDILASFAKLLKYRPKINKFHIYYDRSYIISLKIKQDKVVLNYYLGQRPRDPKKNEAA